MNKLDKNFIINFSPFLIAAVVMFFMAVAYDTKADDHNYTDHGIKITAEDLAVDTINIKSITGYKWNKTSKILTVKLIGGRLVDIKFRNSCWDMEMAYGLDFVPYGGFSTFITVGDKIVPMNSYRTKSAFPCYIASMTEVIPV